MKADLDSTDLSKNELAAEVLRSFGELRVRVSGSSMLPAIRPDDVLTVRHCGADEVGVGDVVLYTRHRRLFAHRVVSRSDVGLVTQGDGVAKPDPAVSAAELLGKIIHVSRRGMSIRPESKLTSPGRIAAALVRRSAGAGRLLIRLRGLQHRAGL